MAVLPFFAMPKKQVQDTLAKVTRPSESVFHCVHLWLNSVALWLILRV